MSILYIVATPIGNLEDLTFRAARILKEVDFVLCEDTRVTKRLLDHYKIATPTLSYHQHSGELKIEKILELLKAGKNLALTTDAGTPGISDPGGKLVAVVREELGGKVKIESVPGASALAAAVSLAGAGFDRFLFLGFLPRKKGRQTMLKEIAASVYPVILYESKHRIVKLLEELKLLNREGRKKISVENGADKDYGLNVTVARELTKLHESFYKGSPGKVLTDLQDDPNNLKGEFVVLIKKEKN
jgi:16S rRNA (cytidine1402-2'-O)-methyltransferase